MSFKATEVVVQYQKDGNLKPEDVNILVEWTKKQPHLPEISELHALLFLHSCHYRIEMAKSTLDNYFTVRTLCPDIFSSSLEDHLLSGTMDSLLITPLPQRTPEGYTVILVRLMDADPNLYHHASHVKFFDMIVHLILFLNGVADGITVIIDSACATFALVAKFNLVVAKTQLYYQQEAMPIRLKAIHLINLFPLVDKVIAMVKPLMKKELVEMLHFHNSMDSLFDYIPNESLPRDYAGGKAPSLTELHKQINQKVRDNFGIFDYLNQLKVNETKRPGKPKNANDIFGVDGTFKKLEVD